MTLPRQPKSAALQRIYWRDEILQLLFWLEGEGLPAVLDAETVDRYLGADGEVAVEHLERLAAQGYLQQVAGRYGLAQLGRAEGARIFADEFAVQNRPGHGACGTECWCRQLEAEAAACVSWRSAGLVR